MPANAAVGSPSPLGGGGPPAGRWVGLRAGRRQDRSGGAILGEKAMRATLEWPEDDCTNSPHQSPHRINPLPLIPPHLSPPLAAGVFSASPPAGRAIMTSDRRGETGSSRRRPRRGRIGWRAPESNPAPGSRPRLPGLATALPARARPRAAPGDGRHARVKSRRRSRSCRKPRLAGWDGSPFTPTTGRISVPPRPRPP